MADTVPTTTDGAGRVTAVRGAVLDIHIEDGDLPRIGHVVEIADGDAAVILAEVQSHLDRSHVRAIALMPTGGLRRGAVVRQTGGPVLVPVGDAVLGRLLDAAGRVADQGPPCLMTCCVRRSCAPHRLWPIRPPRPMCSRPASR
ncbi:hypothetical protein ACFQ4K_01090 [Tistrella bauzanensis]